MSGTNPTLAQQIVPSSGRHYTPVQRAAIKDWAAWTGLLILGIMLFVAFVLIILGRDRQQILRPLSARAKKRKRKPPPDGWGEAARRLDIRELGAADDDTVDIDPDELDAGDIDEGPGDDGPDDKPPRTGGPRR
jgi:hypothetical protein